MEIWDAYLSDGTPAGRTLVRGEPIPEGLYHLVSEILVRHVDGDYLLMQRDLRKHCYPGYWEATAGGSALQGEDALTCARRELREETGIAGGDFTEIGRFVSRDSIYQQYLCVTDVDKAAVTLQEGETIAYRWVTEDEFAAFVNSEDMIDTQRVRYGLYLKWMGYVEGAVIAETERLVLREMTENDRDALAAILTDAETMRYYPKPYDDAGVRRWLDWTFDNYRKHGFGLWAVTLKETGEFIGDCGITMQPIHGQWLPEVGYHINKAHWRKGYAGEAAAACIELAFGRFGFPAVYSYMNAENEPSWRTAMHNGMTIVEDYDDPDGERIRVCRIDREAWEKRRKTPGK